MNNPDDLREGKSSPAFYKSLSKTSVITGFFLLIFVVALAAALILHVLPKKGGLKVVIECAGQEAVRYPFKEHTRLLIKDGKVSEIGEEDTLESLMVYGSVSDLNILVMENGQVYCESSNCANQVCVHTAPISGKGYEIPIVCLPHGVAVHMEGGIE